MKSSGPNRYVSRALVCALALTLGGVCSIALADPVDDSIPYQGRLLDGGLPVNGFRAMEFCVYDGSDLSTAVQVACDFQGSVGIEDGVFSTRLDLGTINLNQGLWLQVSVDDGGGLVPLEPLTSLGASPQAAYAIDAGSLEGFQASDFAPTNHSHPPVGAGSGLSLANNNYSVDVDDQSIGFDGNALTVQAGPGLHVGAGGVEAHPDGVTIGFTADNRLTVLGGGNSGGGYGNLAVVSLVNGDYSDPVAAMNDRDAWCAESGGFTRCVMFIQPGAYELSSTLFLRPGIAIIGASRDRVSLTRTTTGTFNTVISGDFCAGDCYMENLSVFGTVNGSGSLKTIDIGSGFAELRNMVIGANGGDDLAVGLESSGNEVIAHDIIVSATGSGSAIPLRVTSGSSLVISECLVLGHSFGDLASGLFIVGGSASTTDCQFRIDRNSNFSSSSQAVFVFDGIYSDSGSVFAVGAAGSANGISASNCTGGRIELEGTHITVNGGTGADGIDASTCALLARNARIESSTSNSVGIKVEDGTLEMRHSAVDVTGDGVVGTSTSPLSLRGTISHSVVDARGGDLVNFQQGLRLMFSELRGSGTVNALTCRAITAGAAFTFHATTCP